MKLTIVAVGLMACGTVETVDREPAWSLDHIVINSPLLGVWGSGPHDVWAVGGQADRPLVLHGDGTRWVPRAVPGKSRLWTVYGFSDSDVYAVGERGLIIHYDGQTWTQVESGTDIDLFGLWGASGDDVWIVGTNLATSQSVVLRGARDSFHVVDLPAELMPNPLFKVHGFGSQDVMIVGRGVLHWNGAEWRRDPVPTSEVLFSAWRRDAHDLYAVGGREIGEILHCDGQQWSVVAELPTGSSLYGVFTSTNEPTIAVGANSFVFELGDDGQVAQPSLPQLEGRPMLHGVWGDGDGTTYVVGGSMAAENGVILRRR